MAGPTRPSQESTVTKKGGSTVLEEVQEVIALPEAVFDDVNSSYQDIELDEELVDQVKYYVTCIAKMYNGT